MKKMIFGLLPVVLLMACAASPGVNIATNSTSLGLDPAAPVQIREQFGRLIGTWSCQGFSRTSDGSWQPNPGTATWTWYYTHKGHAIQDLWEAPPGSPGIGVGTNLRIYDEEADRWSVVWTAAGLPVFDFFYAAQVDGDLVMRGEKPTRGKQLAHLTKISFYDITPTRFLWRYEFSPPNDGENWTEASRLDCQLKN